MNIGTFFKYLVIVNIVVLDILLANSIKESKTQQQILNTVVSSTSKKQQVSDDICPQACISQIQESVSSRSADQIIQPASNSIVKEYFVPIGSGTNATDDWEDVPGLQVYVDTTKYGKIKTAYFEASVRIPSLNQWAYVRLFNSTDKHPVWFSEVFFPGGSDPKLLVSDPIVLESGNKLYKVQMKTQLKHTAYLDQSRIHIITQ